jgi:hypothetical protein
MSQKEIPAALRQRAISVLRNLTAAQFQALTVDASAAQVGDLVAVRSRGAFRVGIVVLGGTKNVTVAYTTQGALDQARQVAQYHAGLGEDHFKRVQSQEASNYRWVTEYVANHPEKAGEYARRLAAWAEAGVTDAAGAGHLEAERARVQVARWAELLRTGGWVNNVHVTQVVQGRTVARMVPA